MCYNISVDKQQVITQRCSFCGKSITQVRSLVTGKHANICDGCYQTCGEIFSEELERKEKIHQKSIPTPQEIYQFLDKYVIGQNEAKKTLSIAVYNHYKRINPFESKIDDAADIEVSKSNVLLMGPTGTGKTYLAQSLARIMKVPFAIVDATALTEAGYIGEDVENILLRLIQNADGDVDKASRGIIYIDEIDKLARRGDSASLARDVSGEGVQQGLLKIVEGTVASVQNTNGRKHQGQEFIQIDTSNILFIASGAFSGLEDMVLNRLHKSSVGFGAPLKPSDDEAGGLYDAVETEDLHKYGMIPEFIGRFPVICHVNALSTDDLEHILTVPKNALIKQYKHLFELDGVHLQFEDEAVSAIAKIAQDRGNGARGLRSVLEKVLGDIMFELPSNKSIEGVVVTADSVNSAVDKSVETIAPKLLYRTQKNVDKSVETSTKMHRQDKRDKHSANH